MNLTTGFPRRTGDAALDVARLHAWAVSLTEELKNILCNLDSGNVIEASSVKAQNIDVSQARIKDAQMQSITADKLTAGTIDTGEINISNSDDGGLISIADQSILFEEKGKLRIFIGRNDTGKYIFTVQSADGKQGIYMNEDGQISISGLLETRSDAVIGKSIEVGYGIDPMIKFLKPSGTVGASIYYSDSEDALIIDANNVKFVTEKGSSYM